MKITFYCSDDMFDLYQLCQKLLDNFASSNKILLVTESDLKDKIDREMWTFSQNFFIPHLLVEDLEKNEYSEQELNFIKQQNQILICDYIYFIDNFNTNLKDLAFLNFIFFIKKDNFLSSKDFILNLVLENTNIKDFIFFFNKDNLEESKILFKNYIKNFKQNLEDIRIFVKEDKWNKLELSINN